MDYGFLSQEVDKIQEHLKLLRQTRRELIGQIRDQEEYLEWVTSMRDASLSYRRFCTFKPLYHDDDGDDGNDDDNDISPRGRKRTREPSPSTEARKVRKLIELSESRSSSPEYSPSQATAIYDWL